MNIHFEPVVYNVDEGEIALLELVLSTPSDSEITVIVRLNPGTATGTRFSQLMNYVCAVNDVPKLHSNLNKLSSLLRTIRLFIHIS